MAANVTDTDTFKLRVFTAFSGYDSQCMALDRLKAEEPEFDYELVGWAEIDKYAIQAHNANYPQWADRNYGDISKVDWSEVPDFDLFFYSSPCFLAGTMVLTRDGYKTIEDITSDDYVLTHTNSFQKVVKPMARHYRKDMMVVRSMSAADISCTPEHPFYARRMKRTRHEGRRMFLQPEWVEAKDLTMAHYLGYAINTESRLPEWDGVEDNRWGHHRRSNTLSELFGNELFWYLMGRYVGDGWKKESSTGRGITICCGGRNEDRLVDAMVFCDFNYTVTEERTVRKYTISSNELFSFVDRYGYYAHGKRIDYDTMSLPIEHLEMFIKGYVDSDGCYTAGNYKITSASKDLILGIAQCVAKVHKRPFSINYCERPEKTIIEGREVNQRDSWTIVWHPEARKQDHAFYEDGYIWFPLISVTRKGAGDTQVYNMEVENDNSYTANGAIVHNCQDFSNAGLQKGGTEGSGTRSSLLWECKKAIAIKKPKYCILENVKALVGKKFIGLFNMWQNWLAEQGYSNFWKVLNAKDYGIPQNRERVFLVSILNECGWYDFPEPFRLETRLKDVLEENVDESYYLSQQVIDTFERRNLLHMAKGNGFRFEPKDLESGGGW